MNFCCITGKLISIEAPVTVDGNIVTNFAVQVLMHKGRLRLNVPCAAYRSSCKHLPNVNRNVLVVGRFGMDSKNCAKLIAHRVVVLTEAEDDDAELTRTWAEHIGRPGAGR